MALILQNRSESELSELLTRFLMTMEFQQYVPIDAQTIALFAHHKIETKIQKLLEDWLNDLSVPELMKIKKMCQEAVSEAKEQVSPAIKSQEKVKKKHLQ